MSEEELDMPRGQYDRSRLRPGVEPADTTTPSAEDPRDAEIAALRARLDVQSQRMDDLMSLAARVLAAQDKPAMESQAEFEAKAPPLESVETERARILAAWDAEPRVQIVISPDVNDEKGKAALQAQAKRAGQDPDTVGYPPRIFQVNGVQIAVPVGEMYSVPLSIGHMYEYMLNPWKTLKRLPPITFAQAEARLGLAA